MKNLFYISILLLCFTSCNDYLEVQPVGQVIPETVEDYRSFLTSAYSITNNSKILTSYRSDELEIVPDATGIEQYEDIFIWNDESPSPLTVNFPYASFYTIIFHCNHIIENRNDIEGDQNSIDQLVGEAYALRAKQYFELVNLYAKPYNATTASQDPAVPITTAYETEKLYPASTVEEVYNLILQDLEMAASLISIDQQDPGYNYRFSKLAVSAFKARIFLYQNQWQKALESAEAALNIHSTIQDLNEDVAVMPSEYNSPESILALDYTANFDLINNARISGDLIKAYDAQGDLRFDMYFQEMNNGSFRSKKLEETRFKISLRTSELYLIRAEALTRLEQASLAKEVLSDFAAKRYTPSSFEAYQARLANLDNAALLSEILEERRREFAIEGHRWYDLRRTTQPEITKRYNGTEYTLEKNDERYTIPLPPDARINNPDL